MPGIFISYRRDDSAGFAGALLRELNPRFGPEHVFMDIDDIRGGQDFVRALDEALNACEVLLAVIGPHWLEAMDSQGRRRLDDPSDYVRLEVATALRRDIWVIPILVEGAAIPEAVRLPDDLQTLSTRNALRISNASWHHDVDRLADQIRTAMYAPERAGSAGRPLLPTDFDAGKRLSGQGAVTAVFLILMGILFLGTGGRSGIQTQSVWGLPLIFSVLGAGLSAGGMAMLVLALVRRRGQRSLLHTGRPIMTTFDRVEPRTFTRNERRAYRVITRWRNPISGEVVYFHSNNLWEDPTEHVRHRSITVVVDPNNLSRYVMDLSMLPLQVRKSRPPWVYSYSRVQLMNSFGTATGGEGGGGDAGGDGGGSGE